MCGLVHAHQHTLCTRHVPHDCVCVCVCMSVRVCLITVIAGLLLISECELPGQEYSKPSFKMFRECSNTNPAMRKVMSTEL